MEVYKFEKNLNERFVEYTNILNDGEDVDVVPASRIRSEWIFYVELVIEPVGWRALWKIPRLSCQDFEIHYPTIVVVEVENVDFSELSTTVKVIAVQDENVHLPERCSVPLIELYVTEEQENMALNFTETANCVDQLRFFYNYLWAPWDIDDDENIDWVDNHLIDRLRLYFDMKNGVVCKKTCDVIRTLMREGKDIQAKLTKLESEMSDDEEDKLINEDKTCQLMKYHLRLQQIKAEMEVLENPTMREMLVKNQSFNGKEIEIKKRESRGGNSEAHFVWLGGTLQETIEALKSTQDFLSSNIFIKTLDGLQEALDICDTGDIVVIGRGEHQIKSAGSLEEGGTFKGLGNREEVILCAGDFECGPSLLDFSGKDVVIENLTIDVNNLQAGIVVRKGFLRLINCHVVAHSQSIIKLGVVVLPGAKLIADKTKFTGLGSGLVIHDFAEVTLNNCILDDCNEGVQLHDKSRFNANNCTFKNCKEYGIRMETEQLNNTESQKGDVDILQKITDVLICDCEFENNILGNVNLKSCTNEVFSCTKQEKKIIS